MRYNEIIDYIHQLYEYGEYDSAIAAGLMALHEPLPRTAKTQVVIYIASSYYNMNDLDNSLKWKQKAIELCPKELWQHRLSLVSDKLFMLHYMPDISDYTLAEEHKLTQRYVSDISWFSHNRELHKLHKKIRIGYLSPDFHAHINLSFIIQLLACYDHDSFEIYCYYVGSDVDCVTEQIKGYVDEWRQVDDLKVEAIAQQIYNDEIDILVDVSVHASGAKTLQVVAYKPAPIIVAGIGYMSTSGMRAVDYFLTDVYCDPFNHGDKDFSEKLLRLPHTHLCYTPMEYVQNFKVNTATHSPIIFGSLNSYHKLNKELLMVWLKILNRVPESKLLLQGRGCDKKYIYESMVQLGYPMDRVIFKEPGIDYFATYNEIDIALDSYPYTGGGTTCDAIYMGVPVISRYGTRHGNRFGYSLLYNMGMEALTADSWDDYIEKAILLANNKDVLTELHGNLREIMRNSPVMNGHQYTREIEQQYKCIWCKY